jgi:hypothetical protein
LAWLPTCWPLQRKVQANNAFTPPSAPALPDVPSSFVLVVRPSTQHPAIAYLPAHVTMRHVGQLLAANLAGVLCDPTGGLAAANRQVQFAALLGLDEGIREQVRRAAGLLAPLLAALVTTLLPEVKLRLAAKSEGRLCGFGPTGGRKFRVSLGG